MHFDVRVFRLNRNQLAAELDRPGVLGPGREIVIRELPAIADLAVAGRKLVAGEHVVRLVGDPALGKVSHLAEPVLGGTEVAVEAKRPAQPEVSVEQGGPRLAPVCESWGVLFDQHHRLREMLHPILGSIPIERQLAQAGVLQALRQMIPRSRGTFGLSVEGGTGCCWRTWSSVSTTESPPNGGLPVSNAYRTAPKP